MIISTGSSGFIGKNICKAFSLPKEQRVDFNGDVNPYAFIDRLKDSGYAKEIDVIIHNGACSSTTESNIRHLMEVNFDYSVALLKLCIKHDIKLIYASSASVYGDGPFYEDSLKKPKSPYALSKSLFDDYAMQFVDHIPQIVGLRYFNVYGPHEGHKGDMASVMFKFYKQMIFDGEISIFEQSEKYLRDFVYIDDVIGMTKYFCNNDISGIFNVGTDEARSFYDIAKIYCDIFECRVRRIPMPEKLIGKYQEYTKSDNSKISEILNYDYTSLEDGISAYIEYLKESAHEEGVYKWLF